VCHHQTEMKNRKENKERNKQRGGGEKTTSNKFLLLTTYNLVDVAQDFPHENADRPKYATTYENTGEVEENGKKISQSEMCL